MSGHSKWANIKHRKGKQDALRGKIFTKLIRELTVAARRGGSDPNSNSELRLVMDKAFSQNMPRDTIERAIKRGAGENEGTNLEEVLYEGYGPSGVAFIVECLTDNKNRTVGDVRHVFTKAGGSLGSNGSVSYLFNKKGVLSFADNKEEDKIMEVALDAGALDVIVNSDQSVDVFTDPANYMKVYDALVKNGLKPENAELMMLATTEVDLTENNDVSEKVEKLIDALEDLDDCQNVYHNAKLPESDDEEE